LTENTGMVFAKSLGRYSVRSEGRTVVCTISSKLRKRLLYPTADPSSIRPHVVRVEEIAQVDPIAVGDIVSFMDSGDGTGMITQARPRRTAISRAKKSGQQVVAANVDRVVGVLSAANPALKWGLLDRYLVSAESCGVPALICIAKMDLVDQALFGEEIAVYREIGYPVVLTSAVTGLGLDALQEALTGRVSVLVGKSGVGKTTLLNAVQPGLGLRVQEVSASTGKGKHTTSDVRMFELDFGGSIIDTPGTREFGLWEVDGASIAGCFPEMRPFLGLCRFGSCTHAHEPGCAVKEAVENGRVSERRYNSYLRLRG